MSHDKTKMSNPSVDLDEILGYKELRDRGDQLNASDVNLTDFAKHRVFLNQVDTFNAKQIASVST